MAALVVRLPPGRLNFMSISERGLKLRTEKIKNQLSVVFTTAEAIDHWLDTPSSRLGGKTPRDELATPTGTAAVEDIVTAIIHGFPW